jgi:hypothetical protein
VDKRGVWTDIANWAQNPHIQDSKGSNVQTVSNSRACDYRKASCVCKGATNIQGAPAQGSIAPSTNKQKIFSINILPMINQNVSDMNSFNNQLSYSKSLYQALFKSDSWWKQLNNYYNYIARPSTSSTAKMGAKTSQTASVLNTVLMPFKTKNMTDFYIQLWIRSLVNSSSITLLSPTNGTSSQEVKNILAIQTNVNVINPSKEMTCEDICAYHSTVDVSDITKIVNQSVHYMVVPHISSSCKACNALSVKDVLGPVISASLGSLAVGFINQYFAAQADNKNYGVSVTASHELAEVVVSEALGGLKNNNKSEVADICVVITFIPILWLFHKLI